MQRKRKERKKLTIKEAKFVREYARTGNALRSVLHNYDIGSRGTKDALATAHSLAVIKLRHPLVQEAVKKEAQKLADRIPDDLVIEKHLELLNKKDLLGEIDVPAVSSGLDKAYRLKGAYAPERSVGITVYAKAETLPHLEKLREEYEEKLKNELLQ